MPAVLDAATKALNTDIAIHNCIQTVCADVVRLAEIVAGGPFHFRVALHKTFREGARLGLINDIDDARVNQMFAALCVVWQRVAAMSAKDFLDRHDPVSPPTPADIDAAWTVESASSDAANKVLYGDLKPAEYLEKLNAGATPYDLKQ